MHWYLEILIIVMEKTIYISFWLRLIMFLFKISEKFYLFENISTQLILLILTSINIIKTDTIPINVSKCNVRKIVYAK